LKKGREGRVGRIGRNAKPKTNYIIEMLPIRIAIHGDRLLDVRVKAFRFEAVQL
jgi:hypothetical protein